MKVGTASCSPGSPLAAAGLAAVLALGILGTGCADDPLALGLGAQCDLNSECEAPLACRLARCRRECATLRDCPIDALCVTDNDSLGACTLPEEQSCTLASDCPEPLLCAMGRCVNECAADADCPTGARCEESACIDPVEDACSVDGDCLAPLVCAADRRCRDECVTHRDCREGTRCEEGQCLRPTIPPMDAGPPDSGAVVDAGMDSGPADVDAGDDGWDPGSFWRDGGPDGGPLDGSLPLCMDGSVCPSAPNATTGCVDGRCEILSCTAPWADCNGLAIDGCETNTATHRDHCTACGSACPAGDACLDGACVTATVVDVSVGSTHSCAAWSTGDLTCWGRYNVGQLGNGDLGAGGHSEPVNVDLIDDALDVELASRHACALRADGTVWCWGSNYSGVLGDPTITERATPAQVPGLSGVEALDVGGGTVCARTDDARLHCWGYNRYGGVGDGTTDTPVSTPTEVTGLGEVGLFAAGTTSCAVTTAGALMCWGRDWDGEISGTGGSNHYTTPQAVSALDGLSVTPVAMHAGSSPTVVGDDGQLWCWGSNANFECGLPLLELELWPAMALAVSDVAGMGSGRCVHTATGEVWCWGYHDSGSAGTGTTEYPYDTPRQALGVTDAVQVSSTRSHGCIRHAAGHVSCSGSNDYGQLGDGTFIQRLTFRPVRGMP